MKKQAAYPIILNHLTSKEYTYHKDTFDGYKQLVVAMLQVKGQFLYGEDLLMEASNDSSLKGKKISMELLQQTFPDRFVSIGMRRNNKEEAFRMAWLDLWAGIEITPEFALYDIMFCYNLRNLDLNEIDNFLRYTLELYFDRNMAEFKRFTQITLRKYGESLLKHKTIDTINEWIEVKEKQLFNSEESEGSPKSKSKGIIKRESGDNLTKLNQEQTALLIHFLQNGKIILRDEYLTNKQAGQAFNTLTGYSADTLRQNLSKIELERIANKKNLTDLDNALTFIKVLIEKDLKGKK